MRIHASRLLILLLFALGTTGATIAQDGADEQTTPEIVVDTRLKTTPFPHFWDRTIGSERAMVTLWDDWRTDLSTVKGSVRNLQYIRFHAILSVDGFYTEEDGKPILNFRYVDMVYDGLLKRGVRPFVELGFMPPALASANKLHPFTYHPNVSPPKDWQRWHDLIYAFMRHLVERYGEDEVATWFFEVWNEPNLDFWAGTPAQESYFRLYRETARAVKEVSPRLRVGGPATSSAGWIPQFIDYCVKSETPVDFVSTHAYATEDVERVLGKKEEVPNGELVSRAVRLVHGQVKASKRPDLPIFWTEFNATFWNHQNVTDSAYMGPWLAKTISLCDGYTEQMCFWAISDVFEEMRVAPKPFYGGFGLMAPGNIPKASFNAFKILSLLGEERLPLDSQCALATRRTDGTIVIAMWNYAPPDAQGKPLSISLKLKGLTRNSRASLHLVDEDHGSPLKAWFAMGRPDFPTMAQQQKLREAAALPAPEERVLPKDAAGMLIDVQPHGLYVIEVRADQ